MVKFRLLRDRLVEEGDVGAADLLEPPLAPRADLLLVHTPEYLEDLEQLLLHLAPADAGAEAGAHGLRLLQRRELLVQGEECGGVGILGLGR